MSESCMVGGSAWNHRGRVLRIMVGPDYPSPLDYDAHATAIGPLALPDAFACEGHVEMVRAFLERHHQPRRMAYRDGRP